MRQLYFCLSIIISLMACHFSFADEATLEKAWYYYLTGDYEKTLSVCRVISKSDILGEEGRYIMGLAFLKSNQPQEARKDFQFLLENYSRSERKDEYILGIADSYYIEDNFEKAEEYYIRLLKDFPGTGYASIAYLRLGECQKRLGKQQEAGSSFNKVVQDFTLSLEAKMAKDRLKEEAGFFSVQIGAFSKNDNADNMAEMLRKKGFDAYVEKLYERDRLIYRVKVGRFDTKEKALNEAERLKNEGFSARVCD